MIMRKIIFLHILMISFFSANTQNSVVEMEKTDTFDFNKILVVPLNPKLYFSDADHVLEEYNNRTTDQLFYRWRSAIDINVSVYLMAMNLVKSMLMDTSWDVKQDIRAIYDGVNFGYETN